MARWAGFSASAVTMAPWSVSSLSNLGHSRDLVSTWHRWRSAQHQSLFGNPRPKPYANGDLPLARSTRTTQHLGRRIATRRPVGCSENLRHESLKRIAKLSGSRSRENQSIERCRGPGQAVGDRVRKAAQGKAPSQRAKSAMSVGPLPTAQHTTKAQSQAVRGNRAALRCLTEDLQQALPTLPKLLQTLLRKPRSCHTQTTSNLPRAAFKVPSMVRQSIFKCVCPGTVPSVVSQKFVT